MFAFDSKRGINCIWEQLQVAEAWTRPSQDKGPDVHGSRRLCRRAVAPAPRTSNSTDRPGASADRLKDPQRIPPAVLAWRSALSDSLGSKIALPLDWDEALEAPYFTGRPGWDGFGSLVANSFVYAGSISP